MKMIICAVYDSAIETYGRPFFVTHRGQAIRSFTDEVKNSESNSEIAKHSDDFSLHSIAEYEDSTGQITPTVHQLLIRGKDILKGE